MSTIETESWKRKIPKIFRTIGIKVVQLFYADPIYKIIMKLLTCHDSVEIKELSKLLKLDKKDVQLKLETLKESKLVLSGTVVLEGENERTATMIYYYVNYAALLNIIRYKLRLIRANIGASSSEKPKILYACSNNSCGRTFSVEKLTLLMRNISCENGEIKCHSCDSLICTDRLVQDTSKADLKLKKFNEYVEDLEKLMVKADKHYNYDEFAKLPLPTGDEGASKRSRAVIVPRRSEGTGEGGTARARYLPEWFGQAGSTANAEEDTGLSEEMNERNIMDVRSLLEKEDNAVGVIQSDEDSDSDNEVEEPMQEQARSHPCSVDTGSDDGNMVEEPMQEKTRSHPCSVETGSGNGNHGHNHHSNSLEEDSFYGTHCWFGGPNKKELVQRGMSPCDDEEGLVSGFELEMINSNNHRNNSFEEDSFYGRNFWYGGPSKQEVVQRGMSPCDDEDGPVSGLD